MSILNTILIAFIFLTGGLTAVVENALPEDSEPQNIAAPIPTIREML